MRRPGASAPRRGGRVEPAPPPLGDREIEALQALLYGASHPYGRPAKGTVESVERIRRADLTAYHAARFAPSTLFVVIAGDVRPADAIARVAAARVGVDLGEQARLVGELHLRQGVRVLV